MEDYNIPLYLSHTVTEIIGENNLEKIIVSKMENFKIIPGTEMEFEVDTLLLSIGLIPENEISERAGIILDPKTRGPIVDETYQTNIEGIFACGNALHVHDLVDFVTEESRKAGENVARYLTNKEMSKNHKISMKPLDGVSYIVPQVIHYDNLKEKTEFFLRVKNEYKKVELIVKGDNEVIKIFKKRHMAPAEMEKIMLKKSDLKPYKTITMEVA